MKFQRDWENGFQLQEECPCKEQMLEQQPHSAELEAGQQMGLQGQRSHAFDLNVSYTTL